MTLFYQFVQEQSTVVFGAVVPVSHSVQHRCPEQENDEDEQENRHAHCSAHASDPAHSPERASGEDGLGLCAGALFQAQPVSHLTPHSGSIMGSIMGSIVQARLTIMIFHSTILEINSIVYYLRHACVVQACSLL